MRCFYLVLLPLLVVSTLSGRGNADDRDDELFRLRLENAALRARIEAGIAELTKPLDSMPVDTTQEAAPSLENFRSGAAQLPMNASSDIDYNLPPEAQPTPLADIHRALAELGLTESSKFGDIGCGADARVVIEAARVYRCKCIGIEIDPGRAASARRAVKDAGLDNLITIIEGDASKVQWDFDVAFVYLWPETLRQLSPKLKRLKRIVSIAHYVPGIIMTKHDGFYSSVATGQTADAPRVTAPRVTAPLVTAPAGYAQQPQQLRRQQNVAYWQGQPYTGRLCTSGRCAMCNSIAQQLYGR